MRPGVNGAVLHPPSWDAGSNEMAVEAAKKYPDRFCILGWFPLDKPEERKRIETWKQRPGMLGLRWSLTRPEQENWHKDGTMDWVWPAAEKRRHTDRHDGLALPAAVQGRSRRSIPI